MISVEIAKTGHPVLKKHDRFLASSFDPMREARAWAGGVVSSIRTQGSRANDNVIIFGLGSGYHVMALREQRPDLRITVVEPDAAVVHQVAMMIPSFGGVEILVEVDWHRLLEHELFRDIVGGAYLIAQHPPSCQIEPAYFGAVDRLLRGRDSGSFLSLLKARPELYSLFLPEQIAALKADVIGIKDIVRLFGASASARHDRRLWRVLEELVA